MNEQNDPCRPDDRILDLLVDDELDENDRRRLLSNLESQPDGWRQCAMAFLQAQAWRRAMSGLGKDAARRPSVSPPARVLAHGGKAYACTTQTSDGRSQFPWYATAASVLFAFALGALSQRVVTMEQSGTDSGIVEANGGRHHWPDDDPIEPTDRSVVRAARPGSIVRPNTIRETDANSDADFVSASPAQMVEALRRSGHRIRRQRGIIPFSFEDGRQGFVPVEDLYVVPVKLTTY